MIDGVVGRAVGSRGDLDTGESGTRGVAAKGICPELKPSGAYSTAENSRANAGQAAASSVRFP